MGPDRLKVVGQRLGGGKGGELGDGVGRLERGPEQTGHRGGVDHVALGALGDHPGYEGPDPVEDPPQVGAEHELEVLGRPIPDEATDEHPGVVAHHVDRAQAVEHRVGQRVDGSSVAHVAGLADHSDRGDHVSDQSGGSRPVRRRRCRPWPPACPSPAKARLRARPIPLPAPVTTAVFPRNSCIGPILSSGVQLGGPGSTVARARPRWSARNDPIATML